MRTQPPVHPFGPVLLALIALVILGAVYGIFGIGKDALIFAASVLIVLGMPVVVVFGITGIVLGVRRLLRRLHGPLDEKPARHRKPPQLS